MIHLLKFSHNRTQANTARLTTHLPSPAPITGKVHLLLRVSGSVTHPTSYPLPTLSPPQKINTPNPQHHRTPTSPLPSGNQYVQPHPPHPSPSDPAFIITHHITYPPYPSLRDPLFTPPRSPQPYNPATFKRAARHHLRHFFASPPAPSLRLTNPKSPDQRCSRDRAGFDMAHLRVFHRIRATHLLTTVRNYPYPHP